MPLASPRATGTGMLKCCDALTIRTNLQREPPQMERLLRRTRIRQRSRFFDRMSNTTAASSTKPLTTL